MIFRTHPSPSPKDLERLQEMLAHFDISVSLSKELNSKDLQRVLKDIEGRPEEKFLSMQVLRSLQLAHYSDRNEGHYGLAKKNYTHFTSPIRRYPDLMVHRILKKSLRQQKVESSSFSSVALHCSRQERNAEEAERDLVEWRIFRFLKGKLGDEFEGIITDISKAGLVVELDGYFVDGVVPYSELKGDYYIRKTEKFLIGRKTGKTFELGNALKVRLASVDPILRRITFALCNEREEEIP